MLRTALAVTLIAVVAASALAAPREADWRTDLGAARKEAWERGVPMLIFLSRFG
jgi:hypothetical protein